MDRQKVISFLGQDWTRVESLICESLETDIPLLNETNRNILSHGGKMLRPMLSLLVARACGEINRASWHFAAAAEMLHNATLLHDDVADESSERRGFPTTSSVLGGTASVLLGDFWLVKAEMMILNAEKSMEQVIRLFAKTLSDLAEGEMIQLQKAVECDTTEEDYFRIIYSKTASLFEAACVSGALSVDAPEKYVEAARDYAVSLGMAFQIKDDIFDYVSSDALGKPDGVDLSERKITLPLLGVLRSQDEATASEIRQMVCHIEGHREYFDKIRSMVMEQGGIEYAKACLDRYIASAKEALMKLPESEARQMLGELADYTAYRNR